MSGWNRSAESQTLCGAVAFFWHMSRQLMKVQIFIPTFNRSAKLRRAIDSVLKQSYPYVEVCVLDNHSTDDTATVVAALMRSDSRIKYIRHDENIGMIANFNAVQKLVNADFFSVLADDDEYEPCFVTVAIECFQKKDSIQFVACNALTKIGDRVVKSQLDHWEEGFCPANRQNLKCVLGHYPLVTNCLFKSRLSKEFCFHPDLGNVSDGLLLTCLFAKYDSYVTKTVTGHWNNDGENASSLQKFDPVRLVNIAINELRLYREFCKENAIAMRGLFLFELKKLLTILVAADRSNFKFIYENSNMRDNVGALNTMLLRFLYTTRVIRLALMMLAGLRRFNIQWVVWRERLRVHHS